MNYNLIIKKTLSFFETGCDYIAQVGLKLMILLPQPPEYWDYRSPPAGSPTIIFLITKKSRKNSKGALKARLNIKLKHITKPYNYKALIT
jgi:hypothetical protein